MVEPKTYIRAEEAGNASPWPLPEFESQGGRRVASAEKEARDAKLKAQQAAKEVVEDVTPPAAPSAEEIEAIRAEAQQAGFDEGYQKGLEKGLAQGREKGEQQAHAEMRAQLESRLEVLAALISELGRPTETHKQILQQQLAGLIAHFTRRLVHVELSTPSEHIESLVRLCLAQLPAVVAPTQIKLNPEDLAYLKGEALLADMADRVELIADVDISPGGCSVESAASSIDARIESLLDQELSRIDQLAQTADTNMEIPRQKDEDGSHVE